MTPAQYRAALAALDLTATSAARLLGVTDRTARYWAKGDNAVPSPVAILLRLMLAGRLAREDVEAAASK